MNDYKQVEGSPSSSTPIYESGELAPLAVTGVMFPGAWVFAQSLAAIHCLDPRSRFAMLAVEWHDDTDHLSSPVQIAMHEDYQKIIGMGSTALPFILEDLRDRGGLWYWALNAIAEESPVPEDDAGNIPAMKASWLHWGAERGYIFSG